MDPTTDQSGEVRGRSHLPSVVGRWVFGSGPACRIPGRIVCQSWEDECPAAGLRPSTDARREARSAFDSPTRRRAEGDPKTPKPIAVGVR
jgi:hypothetical protein